MIGEILNNGTGAIVLAVKPSWKSDEGDIILCFIPSRREFVTWFQNCIDGVTSSGHYTLSLEAAVEDFKGRS